MIRSSENQTDVVGSGTRIPLNDSGAYDLVKTRLSESEQKRKNHNAITMLDSGPCDLLVLPLLITTPTVQFSLDHKQRTRKRNRKKWKRSDSSDSDSVKLTTPLMTPIFDIH